MGAEATAWQIEEGNAGGAGTDLGGGAGEL